MASSTDYAQEYQQAEKAYMQGNYQQAAAIIDRLVEASPNDPSARLLRGHIYCYGLQQYQVAQEQYESVLTLTSEQDFLDYASNAQRLMMGMQGLRRKKIIKIIMTRMLRLNWKKILGHKAGKIRIN
jgi:tetratricopeptide (TPR) repeat protein